jgi:hypothetical protein
VKSWTLTTHITAPMTHSKIRARFMLSCPPAVVSPCYRAGNNYCLELVPGRARKTAA